ncbi:hypothetical protein C8R43DRAFT_954071 [Mycena crocata]|nr:hypothetical protein C8R43DRAFT_954071 [Mycena crocata]
MPTSSTGREEIVKVVIRKEWKCRNYVIWNPESPEEPRDPKNPSTAKGELYCKWNERSKQTAQTEYLENTDRKPCGGPDRPEIGRSPEARTRPEVEGRLFSQTPQLRRVCDCLTVKPGQEWKGSTIRRAAGGGPEKRGNRMIRIDRSSSEAKTKSVKDVQRSKVQPQSRVKDIGKSE